MCQMLQPLYSHHLASSDFYLFSTVKDWLNRIHTADGDDLFERSLGITQEILIDELGRISIAWIDLVREVSERNSNNIG
jgi:hypothetical protein